MKKLSKILIIAGSDPSGGAGLQADIKSASAQKVYSAAVPTCLTAQSTKRVAGVFYPPISFLRKQLEEVLGDIKFDCVKIGMLGNVEIIDCVADMLLHKASEIPLVLDPVMVATSGDLLLEKNAVEALKSRLIKGAFLVTPNIDEAKILADMPIKNLQDMQVAAFKIKALGAKNVLIKGGHLNFRDGFIKNILLDEKNKIHLIKNKKIAVKKLHGTGCSLASAIAANIAKKMNLAKAVKKANDYIYRAAASNLKVGEGARVLQHFV